MGDVPRDVLCRSEKLDRYYEALANTARRETLQYLRGQQRPISVPTLADELVVTIDERPERLSTVERRHRMSVRLTHVHLPKLAAAGLVEWDRDQETVSLSQRFDETDPAPWPEPDTASELERAN